jgi:membrane-associated HD superfamily phosphohydrolase
MVNVFRRTTITTLVCSQLIFTTAARELAEYRVGDKVEENIITPVPLMVVDPTATEALKEKESQRIPVIFRFDKTAADVVETEIRETFSLARSNFVRLMHSSFHHTRLEEDQLETKQFNKLIASFKKQNKAFPLSRLLAEDWALGSDGLAAQITLLARVRQVMEQPIRFGNLTNAPKIGSQVLLVSVKGEKDNISMDDVNTRGTREYRTNLLTMSRARSALLEKFSTDEEDAARFAVHALRVNCFLENELTLASRTRHAEAFFVADNYQAGQVVAKQGQLVDRKIMAALSQIQEKTVAGRLQQQVSQEKVQVAQAKENNRWLVTGLIAAGTLLFALLAWLAFRREPAITLLPAVVGSTLSTDTQADAGDWQQRALDAEQKVACAHDAIRSGVMEQLKEKAVSSLVTQRSDMMEAQHAAAAEMAELERRLNELQAPLQDRLRAYEGRIADLEKALAAKGEENRELIKAKIALMRKHLEAERKGGDLQFN